MLDLDCGIGASAQAAAKLLLFISCMVCRFGLLPGQRGWKPYKVHLVYVRAGANTASVVSNTPTGVRVLDTGF